MTQYSYKICDNSLQLFDREKLNIRRHVLNVFKENEVDENNNVHFLHVNNVKKPVPFYSLDDIISVGYRVKSNRGVEFRRWANSVLKDAYDYRNIRRPKGNEAICVLSYDVCMKLISNMRFGNESKLLVRSGMILSREV